MRNARPAIGLVSTSLLLLVGCQATLKDGIATCVVDSDCPSGFVCRAESGDDTHYCFSKGNEVGKNRGSGTGGSSGRAASLGPGGQPDESGNGTGRGGSPSAGSNAAAGGTGATEGDESSGTGGGGSGTGAGGAGNRGDAAIVVEDGGTTQPSDSAVGNNGPCEAGYARDGNGDCANIDDCPSDACAGGTCKDGIDAFTCDCGAGYQGTGTTSCTDIDECATDNGRCGDSAYVDCANVAGASPICVDIRECDDGDNGGCGGRVCMERSAAPPVCSGDVDECRGTNVCLQPYTCYNRADGDYYDCRGQFPAWQGVGMIGPYNTNGTIVTDTRTGLTWERDISPSSFTWSEAKSHCAELSLPGAWRLPTKAELESLVNYARSNPAMDTSAFTSASSSIFWTSSPYVASIDTAWAIDFSDGHSLGFPSSHPLDVRCVR